MSVIWSTLSLHLLLWGWHHQWLPSAQQAQLLSNMTAPPLAPLFSSFLPFYLCRSLFTRLICPFIFSAASFFFILHLAALCSAPLFFLVLSSIPPFSLYFPLWGTAMPSVAPIGSRSYPQSADVMRIRMWWQRDGREEDELLRRYSYAHEEVPMMCTIIVQALGAITKFNSGPYKWLCSRRSEARLGVLAAFFLAT